MNIGCLKVLLNSTSRNLSYSLGIAAPHSWGMKGIAERLFLEELAEILVVLRSELIDVDAFLPLLQ